MNFTATKVKGFKPKDKPYNEHDGGGLYLRVYPGGTKTWLYIFNMDKKRYWYNLGNFPEVSLSNARLKRDDAKKLVKAGKNPVQVDRGIRSAEQGEPTVDEMVKDFLKRYVTEKAPRSYDEYKRNLEKDVIPAWGDLKVKDITRRDVHQLLESIIDRGAKNQANQVFKIVRAMFNWAVPRYDLDFSPCSHVKLPSTENKKERFLSESEIRTFFNNLPDAELSESLKQALRLILITAQRPGEVIGLHSKEIDGSWWTTPAERSKNKKEHRVYLNPLALEIVNSRPSEGFLFPSPRKSKDKIEKPIEVNALAKATRRNQYFGLEHFTPHDLRRTAASHLAAAGYSDEVIAKILNHTRPGVTSIYNRYKYDDEVMAALETWGRKLSAIVLRKKSDNVIPIAR
jgi:integrase